MPAPVRRLLASMPVLKPVIPDPGIRFQLVHEEDVAQAFVAGVLGRGEPGPYNLAGNGALTMKDVAEALDWYSVPVSKTAVQAMTEVATRMPLMPDSVAWLHSIRKEVLMKTERAKRQLRWKPKHNSRQTLKDTVAAHRSEEPAAR